MLFLLKGLEEAWILSPMYSVLTRIVAGKRVTPAGLPTSQIDFMIFERHLWFFAVLAICKNH